MRCPTPASPARRAACAAVVWLCLPAFSASASMYVASWISTSTPRAASTVPSAGLVSPVYATLMPGTGGPTTMSGVMAPTDSPRFSLAMSGPSLTPRDNAFS